ncbi:hypothetical protein EDC04DRAFT_2805192 [Pisolithus marmoratus]|nr:hypothetical protein EDC04DRAFT_2805192 [Pisolithus marmoratus]
MPDLPSLSWQATLQSETPTPSLPGQALPSTSTVQLSQSPTNYCHLGYKHRGAMGFSTVDARAPQHPTSTGNVSAVSTEALQKPGYRAVPSQRQTPYSSLAGHYSAPATSPSDNIGDENGASSLGHNYWRAPNHASDHVTNHSTTLLSPRTIDCPQLHAMGQLPRYAQENWNMSPFEFQHPRAYPGFTTQSMQQTHFTPFPPTSSQHNPTSYTAADNHALYYPSSQITSQMQASQFPQERIGPPFPVHSLHTEAVDLPDPREIRAGSEMAFHTTGTVDDRTAHVLSDHRLPTLSDYGAQGRATYAPNDHTEGMTSGVMYDHGNFNENRHNSGRVMSSRLNQHSFSPYEHPSRNQVSRVEGGDPPGARSVCQPNDSSIRCGWRNDVGEECGVPITLDDYALHFADFHDIKDIARHVKIPCRWCPLELEWEITRNNILRHLREVHFHCPRQERKS